MKKAKYNLEQKKLLAKVNNMCGSVLFVSDDIGAYDETQLQILKDSYKPFTGKITMAEYVAEDVIRINYLLGDEKYALEFNTCSGKYADKKK